MPSPDFNQRGKPHEHPQEIEQILEAFQTLRGVDKRYEKLGDTPTSPAYMRNVSLAVTGARILALMDHVEQALYNPFERTPEDAQNSTMLMEMAILDPEFSDLSGIKPTPQNTVQAQSALHMAAIYSAWVEYHLTNVGLSEMDRMGIGAIDDLNAFRTLATTYIAEAAEGFGKSNGPWEARDLRNLNESTDLYLQLSDSPTEAVHPVDKLVMYFSNIQGEPTPESLRFIHILDQRKAAIFAPSEDDRRLDAQPLEM